MNKGWLVASIFGGAWIALKLLAYTLQWNLDEIQPFVLLNMALLTAAIALFMYRKKDLKVARVTSLLTSKQG